MSATVTTRKADENLRQIDLIGNVSHQIVGAKLPSIRQVFQVLCYNTRFVKLDAKKSAELAVNAVLIFWNQARIPTREHHKCVTKLLKLHEEYRGHQKRDINQMSAATKSKYDQFFGNLDNLFDIAHADAIIMMRNEEDIAFLELQRQPGRPGSMIGVDQKLADKEERTRLRKEQEDARKLKHAQAEAMNQSREYFFMRFNEKMSFLFSPNIC